MASRPTYNYIAGQKFDSYVFRVKRTGNECENTSSLASCDSLTLVILIHAHMTPDPRMFLLPCNYKTVKSTVKVLQG